MMMGDTALIIAAGLGSRLDDGTHTPKPLRFVCGMTLLKRAILSAARAGLKRVIVVVGFEKEKIQDYIAQEKWPIAVETIENPDWQKSNGVSVLAAKTIIKNNFVLLMSDHVFAVENLQGLMDSSLQGITAKLAIDRNLKNIFDIDDATKVQTKNHLIQNIGKGLTDFDAVDTGMFLLSPEIFSALQTVYDKKDDVSLSDGIRLLAEEKQMGVYEIKNYWQDVDTPESLQHAEKLIFESCRKPTDGFIAKHINRKFSLMMTRVLIKTKVSADMMTLLTTLVGLLSGYLATFPNQGSYAVAGFLFEVASILDGVDGEMSRIRFSDSKRGQWFDTISDNLTYLVFIVGTFWGVLNQPELGLPEWVSYAAVFGLLWYMLFLFVFILTFTKSGSLLAIQKDFAQSKNSILVWVGNHFGFIVKRDFFATLFFVLALFGKPHWVLTLVALATNSAGVILFFYILKRVHSKHSGV